MLTLMFARQVYTSKFLYRYQKFFIQIENQRASQSDSRFFKFLLKYLAVAFYLSIKSKIDCKQPEKTDEFQAMLAWE